MASKLRVVDNDGRSRLYFGSREAQVSLLSGNKPEWRDYSLADVFGYYLRAPSRYRYLFELVGTTPIRSEVSPGAQPTVRPSRCVRRYTDDGGLIVTLFDGTVLYAAGQKCSFHDATVKSSILRSDHYLGRKDWDFLTTSLADRLLALGERITCWIDFDLSDMTRGIIGTSVGASGRVTTRSEDGSRLHRALFVSKREGR
jgi:hypothetical protein